MPMSLIFYFIALFDLILAVMHRWYSDPINLVESEHNMLSAILFILIAIYWKIDEVNK